jgi:hypothetical protein
VETCIQRPRKTKILRQKIRELKIPVDRKLLTFVRTNKRSVQEFGRHPNAKPSSAKGNNTVKSSVMLKNKTFRARGCTQDT